MANKYGLKTPEYGAWFVDKSPYSNKEVETFRYFEILTADPSAVIVNSYESNLGDTESMSRDTLASFLRWQYEGQYSRLSDRIQPTAARYLEQVEHADSLKRLWSIYQAATNDDTVSAAQCSTIYRAAALQAGKLDESRGVRL